MPRVPQARHAVTSRRLAPGALLIGVAVLASPALGATPCADDIEKLCPKVPIGGGRIQACLKEHEKELSPECAGRYENLAQEAGRLAAQCRYDLRRFCWDVAPGHGRLARCLERHRGDLSATCEQRLRKITQPAAE